jgi:hypothetical protein
MGIKIFEDLILIVKSQKYSPLKRTTMNFTITMKKLLQRIKILTIPILLVSVHLRAQDANLQWVKSVGGAQADVSHDIGIDYWGNIYTVGAYTGLVDFDPGPGTFQMTSGSTSDIFVTKMDPAGNFIWAKGIGGSNTFNTPWSMSVDSAGNVYVTGNYVGTTDFDPGIGTYTITSNSYDIFVFKLNSAGSFVWAKVLGGAGSESGKAISLTKTGQLVYVGNFDNTVDFDPGAGVSNLTSNGNTDAFVCKMDTAGNFLWVKGLGGSQLDVANAVTLDLSGNIIVTGGFYATADFDPSAGTMNLTSLGGDDAYIVKLDPSGNLLWANSFEGVQDYGKGTSVVTDQAGNIYSSGIFKGLVDFEAGAGTTTLTTSNPADPDSYVMKLDPSGVLIWVKQLGGSAGSEYAYSIDVDKSGNVYTTGFSNGTADYDPGSGVYNLEPHIFVSKLSTNGNFMWAKSFVGPGLDEGAAIYVDQWYNVFVAGYFYNTVDFDPRAGVSNVTSNGIADAFILKLCQMNDPIVSASGPLEFCSGNSVTLSADVYPDYLWSNGATTQTTTITATGDYSVAVTNSLGCTAISSIVTVSVNTIPVMPSAISGSTTVCEGAMASYSVPAIINATAYTWTMPSGWAGASSTNTISLTADAPGGILMVSATNTCGSSPSQTLNISGNSLPSVTYNQSVTLVCVTINSLTLDPATPAGGTYSGMAVTGNVFDPSAAGTGTFDIVYSFTDANLCSNTDTSTITVDLCTGLSSNSNAGFYKVFPNPSSGKIQFSSSEEVTYILTNELGQVIKQFSLDNSNGFTYTITDLPIGLYVAFGKGSYQLIREKIVVTD